ncbi:hypothetical protein IFR05_007068 [Cadophora sp. M221]|nr:hypothetical protein IFR05_007068 [Cadophora sp. M221]
MPGKVMYLAEQVRRELGPKKYILEETEIRTPRLIAYDIDKEVQEIVYRQAANILLELAEHKFDRIGPLSFDDSGSSSVSVRSLTLKMNEVARVGGVFNDEDARRKYTNCRHFQAITSSYISKEHDHVFTLFCDDFRPSNFLLDDDLKLWWIDLEWTYAAPYQMLYSPPHWLVLRSPCRWSEIPGLMDLFKAKFEIFHGILVEEESKRRISAKTDGDSYERAVPELEIQQLSEREFLKPDEEIYGGREVLVP